MAEKSSRRVIINNGTFRILSIVKSTISSDDQYVYFTNLSIYKVEKLVKFLGIKIWITIQEWEVDEDNDDDFCYNEALELYNMITHKYG